MNQHYTYFLSDRQKYVFLVCYGILVYLCQEMKMVENRWSS